DHSDCRIELVWHGVLLVFGAPFQLPLLAGPEHGRTIPLADISPVQIPQCSSFLPTVLSFGWTGGTPSPPYLLALEASERAWLRCGTKMVMAVHQSGGPMPHYFFHLAFGTRTLLDEEGIELPDRSAARAEALAVIRELSEAPTGGNSRRRAG